MIYGIIASATLKPGNVWCKKVTAEIRNTTEKDLTFISSGRVGPAAYAATEAQRLYQDAVHYIMPPDRPRPTDAFDTRLKRSGVPIQFAPRGKTEEESVELAYKVIAGVCDKLIIFQDESQDDPVLRKLIDGMDQAKVVKL